MRLCTTRPVDAASRCGRAIAGVSLRTSRHRVDSTRNHWKRQPSFLNTISRMVAANIWMRLRRRRVPSVPLARSFRIELGGSRQLETPKYIGSHLSSAEQLASGYSANQPMAELNKQADAQAAGIGSARYISDATNVAVIVLSDVGAAATEAAKALRSLFTGTAHASDIGRITSGQPRSPWDGYQGQVRK